ncbi:Bifunctional purine biosynthetic protein ADE1 [Sporothrix stenoceras]|uniref:Bifunctional purine biosynthetic protein ADE1 n=1 Tax=Sporothrix stenoceras TaxID=5173 RepID=A0ABR3ZC64_9PEZI
MLYCASQYSYNVRFGEPETVLPLLSADTYLAEIMLACTFGCLYAMPIRVEDRFSATVVVASAGYPGSYAKGTPMAAGDALLGLASIGVHLKDFSQVREIVERSGVTYREPAP